MENEELFPPRKKSEESLNNRVDIEPVSFVIEQVVQFLMNKAIHEGQKQDQFNPTMLGNVSFFLAYNEISKETKLHFDKHPKVWDVKKIIAEMNNMEADLIMDKNAREDMLDNPFRY